MAWMCDLTLLVNRCFQDASLALALASQDSIESVKSSKSYRIDSFTICTLRTLLACSSGKKNLKKARKKREKKRPGSGHIRAYLCNPQKICFRSHQKKLTMITEAYTCWYGADMVLISTIIFCWFFRHWHEFNLKLEISVKMVADKTHNSSLVWASNILKWNTQSPIS